MVRGRHLIAAVVSLACLAASCSLIEEGGRATTTTSVTLTEREIQCARNHEPTITEERMLWLKETGEGGVYEWSGGVWVNYRKTMDLCDIADPTTTLAPAPAPTTTVTTSAAATATETTPPPRLRVPENPGNTVDCSDFDSWEDAQSWYDTYAPHYGDVALMDGNANGVACEARLRSEGGVVEDVVATVTTMSSDPPPPLDSEPTPGAEVREARVVSVSANVSNLCFVYSDGFTRCIGDNGRGQNDVPDGAFGKVAVGLGHTCALTAAEGMIMCWGDNGLDQTESPPGSFVSVSAGDFHTCALGIDGQVVCWGANSRYQSQVPTDRAFTAVAAGFSFTCGLEKSGGVRCWGASTYGQAEPPDGTFVAIAAGRTGCGIRGNGDVECWGTGAGGLTDSTPAGNFVALDVGADHACAVGSAGTVTCWGNNDSGQADAPTDGSFVDVAVGSGFSCAREKAGALRCWGRSPGGS